MISTVNSTDNSILLLRLLFAVLLILINNFLIFNNSVINFFSIKYSPLFLRIESLLHRFISLFAQFQFIILEFIPPLQVIEYKYNPVDGYNKSIPLISPSNIYRLIYPFEARTRLIRAMRCLFFLLALLSDTTRIGSILVAPFASKRAASLPP